MDSKTFLAVILGINTVAILIGIFFIASFTSTQQAIQFQATQNASQIRFDNTSLVHKYLYDNITGLRQDWNIKLEPILDQITNATQSKIDQDRHYNQTSEDFKKIEKVLSIKLIDHVTLNQVNVTVNKILDILLTGNKTDVVDKNSTNGTVQPLPLPNELIN